MQHHNIDIKRIPEETIYINDLSIASIIEPYNTIIDYEKVLTAKIQSEGGVLTDDNIRVCVPMDLNSKIIMQELRGLYDMFGSPDDENELYFSALTDKVMTKLEIYDQLWVDRDMTNTIRDSSGTLHSKRGIDLAYKIIDFLEKNEGCAETFPFENIKILRKKWNL